MFGQAGKYTGKIDYYQPDDLYSDGCLEFTTPDLEPSKIASQSPVYSRSKDIFNQQAYAYPAPPLYLGERDICFPQEELYLLRFLIKQPGSNFIVPAKLGFMQDSISECAAYQQAHFPDYDDRFVYLTVRSGIVKSVNEDSYHVDGFQGVSVPRHIPEQNYVWADCHPTLFSVQPYFVEKLDPAIHNFHDYFNEKTQPSSVYAAKAKGLYIIDPYHVHARPNIPPGTLRAFSRLCFSPVEIRDDSNTFNERLPRGPYNREDIRNHLISYKEPANMPNSLSHGLF